MCTLILAHRPDATPSILVGANRDESLQRPSSPPEILEERPLAVLAPRDDRAGGTWLGLNAAGVFAGLTNGFAYPLDPDRNSRGEIVFRALESESAGEAAAAIRQLAPQTYNPFHLVVADPEEAFVCVSDGELRTVSPITSALSIVTERSFGAADNPRKRHVARRLRSVGAPSVGREHLQEILSEHRPGSIDSVCVDLEEIDYGTRSSTILSYGGAEPTFLHAEGPPCDVEYDDLSELARRLLE